MDDLETLRRDAARYRYLASRMSHVSHPHGWGYTLDEVLYYPEDKDMDLDATVDAWMAKDGAK